MLIFDQLFGGLGLKSDKDKKSLWDFSDEPMTKEQAQPAQPKSYTQIKGGYRFPEYDTKETALGLLDTAGGMLRGGIRNVLSATTEIPAYTAGFYTALDPALRRKDEGFWDAVGRGHDAAIEATKDIPLLNIPWEKTDEMLPPLVPLSTQMTPEKIARTEEAGAATPLGEAGLLAGGKMAFKAGELFGQLEPPGPGTTGMFYGAKGSRNIQGEGATAQQLAKATKLEELGSGRDEIYRETGMFRGPDGEWRYGWADLSRMESSLYGGGPEPDVLDPFRSLVVNEENLYRAYPEFESGLLAEYRPSDFSIDDMIFSPEGEQGIIGYGKTSSPESKMTGLAHEVGHAVARKEGFDPGTSYDDLLDRYKAEQKRLQQMIPLAQKEVTEGKPGAIELLEKLNRENERFALGVDFAADETYRSKGGEVMSRLEELMLRIPPEDVGRRFPWEMYDVSEESIWLNKSQGQQNKIEGRPAVGASGKPTGAIEYPATPEDIQAISKPTSEQASGYYYHGTPASNLESIKRTGLNTGLAGKVGVSLKGPKEAQKWARVMQPEKIKAGEEPAIIRVAKDKVELDYADQGEGFIKDGIPPEILEISTDGGKTWTNAATGKVVASPKGPAKSELSRIEAQKEPSTGLFSKMEEEILNMPQEKMTQQQFRNYLEGRGVKRGEINESGILGQIADENNRVTKSAALNFLRERQVPTLETQLRGQPPEEFFDPADWSITLENATIEPLPEGVIDDMVETEMMDLLGQGQVSEAKYWVKELNEADPDTYPLDDPTDNWAEDFVTVIGNEGVFSNDMHPSIFMDLEELFRERVLQQQADMGDKVWHVGDQEGHSAYMVRGNDDEGFTIIDELTGDEIEDGLTFQEANIHLRVIGRMRSAELSEIGQEVETYFSEFVPDNLNISSYEEELIRVPRLSQEAKEYKGPHWSQPDIGLHLRTSQQTLDGDVNALFVLENQSDLHQRGRKYGYDDSSPERRKAKQGAASRAHENARNNADAAAINFAASANAGTLPEATIKRLDDLLDKIYQGGGGISPNDYSQPERRTRVVNEIFTVYTRADDSMPMPEWMKDAIIKAVDDDPAVQEYLDAFREVKKTAKVADAVYKRPPRALLMNDQVIETGFNRAVVKAVEQDLDGISWATAEIQKDLYPNAKSDVLYENQYDKKMPAFAKRLGNKYNVRVEKRKSDMVKDLPRGSDPIYYDVWYLPLTKEMKADIKKKGLPLYSGAPVAGLLADQEDAGENQLNNLLGM